MTAAREADQGGRRDTAETLLVMDEICDLLRRLDWSYEGF